jgi:hypothetical protein
MGFMKKEMIFMASNILKITAKIIISHAANRKLTPKELVAVIKGLYPTIALLVDEDAVHEPKAPVTRRRKNRSVKKTVSPEGKAVQDKGGPAVGDPDYREFMESREG